LYGVYDFLIKVSANSIDNLREIIKYNLTQLVGIVTILTLMIVEH
jgi:DNA-binding Lrp family transcriptional regulator